MVLSQPPGDVVFFVLEPPDVVLDLFQGLLARPGPRPGLGELVEERPHLLQPQLRGERLGHCLGHPAQVPVVDGEPGHHGGPVLPHVAPQYGQGHGVVRQVGQGGEVS